MKSETKLRSDHLHEIVDRTHMLSSTFSEFVLEYPGLQEQYPELYLLAMRICDHMGSLYQMAGRAMYNLEEDE